MFDNTTSLGFNLADILTQVSSFLAIPVVTGLVVVGMALWFVPRILKALKRVIGDSGDVWEGSVYGGDTLVTEDDMKLAYRRERHLDGMARRAKQRANQAHMRAMRPENKSIRRHQDKETRYDDRRYARLARKRHEPFF